MDDADLYYSQARTLVEKTGYATISLIQRHLLLGYRQASLLVARLIVEGVVEPLPDHSSQRKTRQSAKPL
jgi:DNA segregation ATPase FtsK/SpoIIIE-like protein